MVKCHSVWKHLSPSSQRFYQPNTLLRLFSLLCWKLISFALKDFARSHCKWLIKDKRLWGNYLHRGLLCPLEQLTNWTQCNSMYGKMFVITLHMCEKISCKTWWWAVWVVISLPPKSQRQRGAACEAGGVCCWWWLHGGGSGSGWNGGLCPWQMVRQVWATGPTVFGWRDLRGPRISRESFLPPEGETWDDELWRKSV